MIILNQSGLHTWLEMAQGGGGEKAQFPFWCHLLLLDTGGPVSSSCDVPATISPPEPVALTAAALQLLLEC